VIGAEFEDRITPHISPAPAMALDAQLELKVKENQSWIFNAAARRDNGLFGQFASRRQSQISEP
jgi:hypothetical protein